MAHAIEGWLHFKNSATRERVAVPAIAAERERDADQGDQSRFALVFRFPDSEGVGEWDDLRSRAHLEGRLEASRHWAPSGFFPADPEIPLALEAEISSMLSERPEANNARIPPEKRVRYARMDEWSRGWGSDLSWDPLYPLANSHRKILELAELGAISLRQESDLAEWLSQAPRDLSASAAAPAPARQIDAPASAQQPAPAVSAPAASSPDSPADLDDPAIVFGGPQAPSFSALAQAAAAKVTASASRPATPIEAEPFIPAEFSPPDEESFLPAEFSPTEEELAPAKSSAPERSASSKPKKPAREKSVLSLRSARLPRQSNDGSLSWESALFAVASFLPPPLFEALKPHWRGSREENGKKQGLYTADALFALRDAGVPFQLDGLEPNERHLVRGTQQLDAERFALAAYSGSKEPNARLLAERAKANILWKRASSALMRGAEPAEAPGGNLHPFALPPDGTGLSMLANFQTGQFSVMEPDNDSPSGFSERHYVQREAASLERAQRSAAAFEAMGPFPSAPETLWMPGYSQENVRERRQSNPSRQERLPPARSPRP